MQKREWERLVKKIKEGFEANQRLNELEVETFGYTRADKDIDWLIDTIDYNLGNITFEKYKELMKAGEKWVFVKR